MADLTVAEHAPGYGDQHLLQFVEEKKKQQRVYDVTGKLIAQIKALLKEEEGIEHVCLCDNIDILQGRIQSLKTDLKRKKMKVSFFGGTSSGKTTTVNAMIGRDLLPSGMGDTTCCFVLVDKVNDEGIDVGEEKTNPQDPHVQQNSSTGLRRSPETSDDDKHDDEDDNNNKDGGRNRCRNQNDKTASYFEVRKVEIGEKEASLGSLESQRHPLSQDRLAELADVGSKVCLDASYIIVIHLASRDAPMCSLLKYDLQIMDCPGITKCRELGEKVKHFCADSDVHVLIVNPKTVMSQEEKDHFLEVARRLPKPDVIIGFSQWDLSAREKRPQEVKARHIDAAFELLSQLGTVTTREEAAERCFFYSGSEALDLAVGEKDYLIKGWQERHEAFQTFVNKIKERATLAGMKAKLALSRETCHDILRQCEECITALIHEASQSKLEKVNSNIKELQVRWNDFCAKCDQFQEDCEIRKNNAKKIIDEEVTFCMSEVSSKMTQTLKRTSVCAGFEEDHVHQYAEQAMIQWYRQMLREFRRATESLCEKYDADSLALYEQCFRSFKRKRPKLSQVQSLFEDELANGRGNDELRNDAIGNVLVSITERSIWATFASTRRRLSVVENDLERSALVRNMAAAAGVFFSGVRLWIRASVESQLRRLTVTQRDNIICPDLVKTNCRQVVESYCHEVDVYYKKKIKLTAKDVLKVPLKKEKERKKKLKEFIARAERLKRRAERIRNRGEIDEDDTDDVMDEQDEVGDEFANIMFLDDDEDDEEDEDESQKSGSGEDENNEFAKAENNDNSELEESKVNGASGGTNL